jgi:DNA-directed RNA polymerase subunit RPC12/RpoP
MDFSTALKTMKDGKIARVMVLGELHTFLLSNGGFKRVFTGDILKDWAIPNEAILSDNWEVVENWITKEDIPKVKRSLIQMDLYTLCPYCGKQTKLNPNDVSFCCWNCNQTVELEIPKNENKSPTHYVIERDISNLYDRVCKLEQSIRNEDRADVLTKYRDLLEEAVKDSKLSVKLCNSNKIDLYKERADVFECCLSMLTHLEKEESK